MARQYWIDPPEEWRRELIDPHTLGPYTCFLVAEDAGIAEALYLLYRDCEDEQAIAMIRAGTAGLTLAAAEDVAALAAMEGRVLQVFRVTSAPA